MRALACLPAIAIAALIWRLSATPNLAIASGWLDTVSRKAAHVTIFGLLCAALVLAFRAQRWSIRTFLLGGAVVALAYACVDEYHQTFVPTRHGTPVDVAIDAFGIGIASIVLAKAFNRRGME